MNARFIKLHMAQLLHEYEKLKRQKWREEENFPLKNVKLKHGHVEGLVCFYHIFLL